jgi:hypothetical protein
MCRNLGLKKKAEKFFYDDPYDVVYDFIDTLLTKLGLGDLYITPDWFLKVNFKLI